MLCYKVKSIQQSIITKKNIVVASQVSECETSLYPNIQLDISMNHSMNHSMYIQLKFWTHTIIIGLLEHTSDLSIISQGYCFLSRKNSFLSANNAW